MGKYGCQLPYALCDRPYTNIIKKWLKKEQLRKRKEQAKEGKKDSS